MVRLRPDAMVEAMLSGWRAQQMARGLRERTIVPRERLVRRFLAHQLAERLRQLGIRSGQSRSAALFQLATDLPAAVLARLLGLHITVAATWQRACAGGWAAYAAEVSRRARKDDNQ